MIDLSKNGQFVQGFLRRIGLTACRSNEEFWNHLGIHHNEDILDQLEQAMIAHNEEGDNGSNLYEFKNQNLSLSLDVSNFSTDLYEQFFDRLIKHPFIVPKKILDLGCDNGIATCFYAMLFPKSEVLGIDIQENAIKCAEALAKKLNISNVTFLKIDFRNILEHFPRYSFDLITSLRSFHEIIGEFPADADDWFADDFQKEISFFLQLVQVLLRDECGEFISCERLSGVDSINTWINLMKKAGLHVSEFNFIEFHEIGQKQQMPVIVTNQQ